MDIRTLAGFVVAGAFAVILMLIFIMFLFIDIVGSKQWLNASRASATIKQVNGIEECPNYGKYQPKSHYWKCLVTFTVKGSIVETETVLPYKKMPKEGDKVEIRFMEKVGGTIKTVDSRHWDRLKMLLIASVLIGIIFLFQQFRH